MITGGAFSDPGATATDLCVGILTSNITVNSSVNTTEPGAYTIQYTVTDSAGNSGTNTRIVNIVAAPLISGYAVSYGTNASTGTPIATIGVSFRVGASNTVGASFGTDHSTMR